jgi:bcr-type benzoyl-CoA reductase subunit C
MTNKIQPFWDAIESPASAASAVNRKTIGHLCSYAPEELVHAAGFHPMRLFSSKNDIILAEEHLQAYCCSLVRGVLEDSLAGRLDFLSGALFPHTCDSIQRLSDIWRMKGKYDFFTDVVLPAKLNTQSARTYMVDVLNRLKSELEKAAGQPITNDALNASIRVMNTIREALSTIYARQSRFPGIIKGTDLYALVKGSMIMDRGKAAHLLTGIVKDLEHSAETFTADSRTRRILISGSICDAPGVYRTIEQSGAVVVGDDLCTGQRWFEGIVEETENPIESIAQRYMDRIACPAKHVSSTFRGEHLVSLAQKHQADGIIFMLLKFCDPHAFDYPYVKEYLDNAGIKSTLVEMDDQQESAGQLSTRIETFIQLL